MTIDADDDVFTARPKAERSIAELLSDLARESLLLLRQEFSLFRAEINDKLSQLANGAAAIAIGALVAFSGWLVLLSAAVLGLGLVTPLWAAALIVGVVVLATGALLAYLGKRRLQRLDIAPHRTLDSLGRTEALLRERAL